MKFNFDKLIPLNALEEGDEIYYIKHYREDPFDINQAKIIKVVKLINYYIITLREDSFVIPCKDKQIIYTNEDLILSTDKECLKKSIIKYLQECITKAKNL